MAPRYPGYYWIKTKWTTDVRWEIARWSDNFWQICGGDRWFRDDCKYILEIGDRIPDHEE